MLFHNGVDRGEAEAGVFARLSGAEERFEEVFLIFFGETKAGVSDGEEDVLAGAEMDLVVQRLGELQVFCSKGEAAAVEHGVTSVNGEIDDKRLELAAIGTNLAGGLRQVAVGFNGVAHETADQGHHLLKDNIEIERLGGSDILAADGEELIGEADGALGALNYLLDIFLERVFGLETGADEAAIAGDDGEKVVEVVGHAAGEAGDGFHFLGVEKLEFVMLAAGDVAAENLDGGIAMIIDAPGDGFHEDGGAIRAHHFLFKERTIETFECLA